MTPFVSICEVGPRDGLQIAKTRMTTGDKVRWIQSIAAAGVKEIEVGSFVPARVIPQLSDTPEVVAQVLATIPNLTVQALAPNLRGVQNAYNAGVHKISIPVSVSEGHSMANLNRMPAQSIEMMREIMAWLGGQPRKVPVVVGCSTAFGCSIDGVVPTAKVVALAKGLADAGVDEIMLADTVGYGHPAQIKQVVRATRDAVGDKLYGLHLHDTCGLGIANALAGLEEGIRAFRCAMPELGSRRLPLCARRLGQRRYRRPGVHAGEHGIPHRDRSAEADRGTRGAARRPAGRADARPAVEGGDSADVPRRGLTPPTGGPMSRPPALTPSAASSPNTCAGRH